MSVENRFVKRTKWKNIGYDDGEMMLEWFRGMMFRGEKVEVVDGVTLEVVHVGENWARRERVHWASREREDLVYEMVWGGDLKPWELIEELLKVVRDDLEGGGE